MSGRDLAFLRRELGDVADALVAENGCFLDHAGDARRLGPLVDLRGALASLGVPLEVGEALVSADLRHAARLRAALQEAGVEADLIPNRDRVMALPRGVDKALGVVEALATLGVDPKRAAAAGDGENDIALLRAVGYGVAVANAVDELKSVADHVTDEAGGDGVASWIEERWLKEVSARST